MAVIPGKNELRILKLLANGIDWREDEIHARFETLQRMYFNHWLMGAGSRTNNGVGTNAKARTWWITDIGRAAIDNILNGLVCLSCGEWLDETDEPGYPRYCPACQPLDVTVPPRQGRRRRNRHAGKGGNSNG